MLWYVRSKNKVIGPFPTGQIQQAILLGRISAQAEVSQDKEEWKPIRQCPQLIPNILKGDTSDEFTRERIAAARRWADERRQERRGSDTDPARKGPGRRTQEPYSTLEYRQSRETTVQGWWPAKERFALTLVFVVFLLAAGVYAGFHWVPAQTPGPQCEAAVAEGVNWQECDKSGMQILHRDLSHAMLNSTNFQGANLFASKFVRADVSYADLSQSNLSYTDFHRASLKGANLRGADLSKADFSDADLSFADLQGAKIDDTLFTHANLANTIWLDGHTCLPGSVGVCRYQQTVK